MPRNDVLTFLELTACGTVTRCSLTAFTTDMSVPSAAVAACLPFQILQPLPPPHNAQNTNVLDCKSRMKTFRTEVELLSHAEYKEHTKLRNKILRQLMIYTLQNFR
jgi:hypothetical protein